MYYESYLYFMTNRLNSKRIEANNHFKQQTDVEKRLVDGYQWTRKLKS